MDNRENRNRGSNNRQSENINRRHRRVSKPEDEEYENLAKRKTRVSDKPVEHEFYVDERKPISNVKAKNSKSNRKKKEKKNKPPMSQKTRKIINIVICSVIILVVITVGVILSLTVLFRTENITAEKSKHYSEEQIVSACGIEYGENLFTSDKKTAEEKIQTQLPYVETAEINIKIPDTLVIEVVEANPAYVIENNGEFIIISGEGKVLEIAQENTFDIPLVKINGKVIAKAGEIVEFEKDYIFSAITEINKSIEDNKFYGIEEISVESSTNITLNYSNRIKIILGLPIDIEYKIITAKEIIEQKLSKTDIGVLDVSDCNNDIKASYFNPDPTVFEEEAKEDDDNTEEPTQDVTEESTEYQTEYQTEETTSTEYTTEYETEYPTQEETQESTTEYYTDYVQDGSSYEQTTTVDENIYY